jgi:plastocyanin
LAPFANIRLGALAVPVVLALAAVVGGCAQGRANQPDLANGKALFIGKGTCGSCHTLARAGTKGTQGPNLDDAFRAAREAADGSESVDSTIEGIVHRQIGYPRRDSIMSPHLVTGKDATDVAAYVAYAAARPGKDTGALAAAGAPEQSDKPAVADGGVLDIPTDPSGALAYQFASAEAPAGEIEVDSQNDSSVGHNIAIEGAGVNEEGDVVQGGDTSSVTVNLKPGEYKFLCTVPGHAEGGMEGVLTVK